MERYDKSALIQISQVFGTLEHVNCQKVYWNGAFRELSNQDFHSL